MCGICGFQSIGMGGAADVLGRMLETIQHRGPDDHGQYLDSSAGLALGHRRLSIIDLSDAGHQPMLSEDGAIVLVYNGEVYNFLELRRELAARGHGFRSRCDTEVVLRAYEEWGSRCVERFAGMFALAAWDGRRRELFLARDPLGMKPLYYSTSVAGAPGFFFASELKAFRAIPGFAPRMGKTALASFLEFGYTFDSEATAYEGVSKLPPGHRLTVREGKPGVPEAFFSPPAEACPMASLDLGAERARLHETLDTVMGQHLIADVPVAILLSGGLDSSLAAALAARRGPVTTVSMGFAGGTFDERPHARQVAEFIGSDHHEVTITPEEIRSSLAETVPVFDDLFDDWGTITTRLLYRKCRDMGIKVVLVGEGSDELFGGYPVFGAAPALRGPLPWRLLKLWHRYGNRRYGRTLLPFTQLVRGFLRDSGGDWFHSVRLFESRHQLPNHYVMKVDKASMSVSVEARAPFLDRRVAEAAYRLPCAALLKDGRNKAILREIAQEHHLLPEAIASRPKFGGSIAMNWMDDDKDFRAYARSIVLGSSAGWTGQLGLRRAMEDYFDHGRRSYRFPHPLSLFRVVAWRLMQLELWSKAYLA